MDVKKTTITGNPNTLFMKLCIPEGLEDYLEGLAREVLRRQPSNINRFAAVYFGKLLALRTDAECSGAKTTLKNLISRGRFIDFNEDEFGCPDQNASQPFEKDTPEVLIYDESCRPNRQMASEDTIKMTNLTKDIDDNKVDESKAVPLEIPVNPNISAHGQNGYANEIKDLLIQTKTGDITDANMLVRNISDGTQLQFKDGKTANDNSDLEFLTKDIANQREQQTSQQDEKEQELYNETAVDNDQSETDITEKSTKRFENLEMVEENGSDAVPKPEIASETGLPSTIIQERNKDESNIQVESKNNESFVKQQAILEESQMENNPILNANLEPPNTDIDINKVTEQVTSANISNEFTSKVATHESDVEDQQAIPNPEINNLQSDDFSEEITAQDISDNESLLMITEVTQDSDNELSASVERETLQPIVQEADDFIESAESDYESIDIKENALDSITEINEENEIILVENSDLSEVDKLQEIHLTSQNNSESYIENSATLGELNTNNFNENDNGREDIVGETSASTLNEFEGDLPKTILNISSIINNDVVSSQTTQTYDETEMVIETKIHDEIEVIKTEDEITTKEEILNEEMKTLELENVKSIKGVEPNYIVSESENPSIINEKENISLIKDVTIEEPNNQEIQSDVEGENLTINIEEDPTVVTLNEDVPIEVPLDTEVPKQVTLDEEDSNEVILDQEVETNVMLHEKDLIEEDSTNVTRDEVVKNEAKYNVELLNEVTLRGELPNEVTFGKQLPNEVTLVDQVTNEARLGEEDLTETILEEDVSTKDSHEEDVPNKMMPNEEVSNEARLDEDVLSKDTLNEEVSNKASFREVREESRNEAIVNKEDPIEVSHNEAIPNKASLDEEIQNEITLDEEIQNEITLDEETPNKVTIDEEVPNEITTDPEIQNEAAIGDDAPAEMPNKATSRNEISNEVSLAEELPKEARLDEEVLTEVTIDDENSNQASFGEEVLTEITLGEDISTEIIPDEGIRNESALDEEVRNEITLDEEISSGAKVSEEFLAEIIPDEGISNKAIIDEEVPNEITLGEEVPNEITLGEEVPNEITLNDEISSGVKVSEEFLAEIIPDEGISNKAIIDEEGPSKITVVEEIINKATHKKEISNRSSLDEEISNKVMLFEEVPNEITLDEKIQNEATLCEDILTEMPNESTLSEELANEPRLDEEVLPEVTIDDDVSNKASLCQEAEITEITLGEEVFNIATHSEEAPTEINLSEAVLTEITIGKEVPTEITFVEVHDGVTLDDEISNNIQLDGEALNQVSLDKEVITKEILDQGEQIACSFNREILNEATLNEEVPTDRKFSRDVPDNDKIELENRFIIENVPIEDTIELGVENDENYNEIDLRKTDLSTEEQNQSSLELNEESIESTMIEENIKIETETRESVLNSKNLKIEGFQIAVGNSSNKDQDQVESVSEDDKLDAHIFSSKNISNERNNTIEDREDNNKTEKGLANNAMEIQELISNEEINDAINNKEAIKTSIATSLVDEIKQGQVEEQDNQKIITDVETKNTEPVLQYEKQTNLEIGKQTGTEMQSEKEKEFAIEILAEKEKEFAIEILAEIFTQAEIRMSPELIKDEIERELESNKTEKDETDNGDQTDVQVETVTESAMTKSLEMQDKSSDNLISIPTMDSGQSSLEIDLPSLPDNVDDSETEFKFRNQNETDKIPHGVIKDFLNEEMKSEPDEHGQKHQSDTNIETDTTVSSMSWILDDSLRPTDAEHISLNRNNEIGELIKTEGKIKTTVTGQDSENYQNDENLAIENANLEIQQSKLDEVEKSNFEINEVNIPLVGENDEPQTKEKNCNTSEINQEIDNDNQNQVVKNDKSNKLTNTLRNIMSRLGSNVSTIADKESNSHVTNSEGKIANDGTDLTLLDVEDVVTVDAIPKLPTDEMAQDDNPSLEKVEVLKESLNNSKENEVGAQEGLIFESLAGNNDQIAPSSALNELENQNSNVPGLDAQFIVNVPTEEPSVTFGANLGSEINLQDEPTYNKSDDKTIKCTDHDEYDVNSIRESVIKEIEKQIIVDGNKTQSNENTAIDVYGIFNDDSASSINTSEPLCIKEIIDTGSPTSLEEQLESIETITENNKQSRTSDPKLQN